MNREKIKNMIIEMRKILKGSLIPIILFQMAYNSLLVIALKPGFNLVSSLLLRLAGYDILINSEIKTFLTSFMGIVTILILIYLAVLIIYYEFAVIIIILRKSYREEKINFIEVLEEGLLKLKFINNFSYLGLGFYILILIPVLNLGIKSSLIPSLEIPNFILGEVFKYKGGEILIFLVILFLIYIFIKLLFVIPIMVIEEKGFDQAAKKSFQLVKGRILKIIWMAILFLIVLFIIFLLPIIILIFIDYAGLRILNIISIIMAGIFFTMINPLALSFILLIYKDSEGSLNEPTWTESKLNEFREELKIILARIKLKVSIFVNKIRNKHIFLNFLIILISLLILAMIPKTIDYIYQEQLIIGHRGSLVGVENTIEAVQGAAKAGADYAEIDLLLSKDNVPMVVHDTNLRRLSGRRKSVYDLTSGELENLLIKSGGYEGYIPSLEKLNEETGKDINLLIEFKTHGKEKASLVEETMKIVEKNNMLEETKFQTAEIKVLKEFKEKYPEVEIGYIIIGGYGNFSARNLSKIQADFLVFEESMINKKLIRNAHLAGKEIYAWTVNDMEIAEKFLEMRIDGIITDYPESLIKIKVKGKR